MNELTTLTRDKVYALEALMKQEPQLDLPVEHLFSLGLYARKLFIPKGTLLTGEIHKYPQINVLLVGDISVLVDEQMVRVQPPFAVCSPSGTKRIAYAHEDTVWLTIHATQETDVDKIENHFIAKSEAEYTKFLADHRASSVNRLFAEKVI